MPDKAACVGGNYTHRKCCRFITVFYPSTALPVSYLWRGELKNLGDLSVCFTVQDDVKRYHRYCNHSGGQAKVERGRPRRSEEEDDNSPHRREQQQHLEIKAIVIQRAWRASTSRRGSWQGQDKNHPGHHLCETVPSESLRDPVMTSNISPLRPRPHTQISPRSIDHEEAKQKGVMSGSMTVKLEAPP
ncbi:hypothetical protein GBF38_012256 [Nibea albiflora]|uniref:Uncharacterized protein n=1 Tax=Nibea albiflora TaxID=240163 RepID=A0ACB7EM83_NIBAL|nr:hypothetical protein GBF38_012256 [Nibea albiflora]